MAGTFTSQNKVRPGAYIVFKAVRQSNLATGERGIVVLPMTLPWGKTGEFIPVTVADFTGGNTLAQIGLSITDAGIQVLREVLKNASKALVWKLNADAVKATKLLMTGITATAAQGGTLGNSIIVSCVENAASALELITTVNGLEVDRQVVTTVASYVPNGWITLAGTGTVAFAEFAGVTLEGGTAGAAVTDTNWTGAFNAATTEVWNVFAAASASGTLPALVATYIENLRENEGKKVQAVVNNYDSDYEGVISVDQGYKIGTEEVPVTSFIGWVAGATAGAEVNQSNTYKIVPGATDIIGAKSASQIEAGLQAGKFILSRRQDLSIVVEKDINTLHTFGQDRSYVFSKNRVIRCLDDIATQVTKLFENSYIGKVDNNASGRTLFKGDIIGYLTTLENLGAIQNFDSTTDLEVIAGNDIESVVVNLAVQTVDSMEKLYMTVVVS